MDANISIHALREEGDCAVACISFEDVLFLSTPSARRATTVPTLSQEWMKISIHALREEGDKAKTTIRMGKKYFYPRPPRGGRQRRNTQCPKSKLFLSTPSARRATEEAAAERAFQKHFYPRPPRGGRRKNRSNSARHNKFLSTPSARRATEKANAYYRLGQHFYPRPPRGGRPIVPDECGIIVYISIHALREEGDFWCFFFVVMKEISIHALREEGDPRAERRKQRQRIFLSTPSARRATAKTARKPSAFVSLYTSLHKLQRGVCKPNRKITPLLAQTAGIPVRSIRENHVRCLFALADIKRSAHYPAQTPGAAQHVQP